MRPQFGYDMQLVSAATSTKIAFMRNGKALGAVDDQAAAFECGLAVPFTTVDGAPIEGTAVGLYGDYPVIAVRNGNIEYLVPHGDSSWMRRPVETNGYAAVAGAANGKYIVGSASWQGARDPSEKLPAVWVNGKMYSIFLGPPNQAHGPICGHLNAISGADSPLAVGAAYAEGMPSQPLVVYFDPRGNPEGRVFLPLAKEARSGVACAVSDCGIVGGFQTVHSLLQGEITVPTQWWLRPTNPRDNSYSWGRWRLRSLFQNSQGQFVERAGAVLAYDEDGQPYGWVQDKQFESHAVCWEMRNQLAFEPYKLADCLRSSGGGVMACVTAVEVPYLDQQTGQPTPRRVAVQAGPSTQASLILTARLS